MIPADALDQMHSALDTDLSPDEAEEKDRLIQQVLELQNTLGGTYDITCLQTNADEK